MSNNRPQKFAIALLRSYRVTLTFSTFYVIWAFIFTLYKPFQANAIVELITDWFSPIEVLTSGYGVQQALVLNFIAPLTLLLFGEVYSRIFQSQTTKKLLSIDAVFLFSIVATYAFSVTYYLATGTIGTGTSILTTCVIFSYIWIYIFDLISRDYRLRFLGKNKRSCKQLFAGRLLVILFGIVFIPTYLYGLYTMLMISNPSRLFHFFGLLFYLLMVVPIVIDRKMRSKNVA